MSAEQLGRFQFAVALIAGTYLFLAESNLLESALLFFWNSGALVGSAVVHGARDKDGVLGPRQGGSAMTETPSGCTCETSGMALQRMFLGSIQDMSANVLFFTSLLTVAC